MTTTALTLTVEEAGRLLGIGRDASYRAARDGDIPTIRVGRVLRVPIGKLAEMLGTTPEGLGLEAIERWRLIRELVGVGVRDYPQCEGTNSDGDRCHSRVVPGTARCHWHKVA